MDGTKQTIEIRLEELGEHSWAKAAFNTVSSSYGSAQFRFVAVAPDPEHLASDHVREGATFPVMRLQDLEDLTEPNGWLELCRARLQQLDGQLVADGWQRRPERGRHWWSLCYARDS